MPWEEKGPMTEREEFVLAALREEMPFARLCDAYGISRKIGYKWKQRFLEGGLPALADRPRTAHTHPHATPPEIVARLLAQKQERPYWGPKKHVSVLRSEYPAVAWPAPSTVDAIFHAHGLVQPSRGKRKWPPRARAPEPTAPNELWYADHKGYFIAGGRRVEPLTVSDGFSRKLIVVVPVQSTSVEETKRHLESAFREHGLPRAMQTDNGGPFGSTGLGRLSRLSVWLLRLGIEVYRSRPGKPTDNGRHERLHATFMKEIHAEIRDGLRAPEAACEWWRQDFNRHRPHEGIGMRRPDDVWQPSERQFPSRIEPFEYAGDLLVRSVRPDGSIKLGGEMVFLSEVLAGEKVGLEPTEEGGWVLHVGPLAVAIVTRDHRVMATRDRPSRFGGEP